MSEEASESLLAARRADARCDEFELALATGRSPQIESFLTDIPPAERQTLLLELLGLELDFRVARGEQPKVGDYAKRFPELSAEQLAALVEASRGRAGVIPPIGSAVPNAEQPTILSPTDAVELANAASAAALRRVRYFGDYELLREIARGGMGVVYEARQRSLNRPVALKMILSGQLASAEEVARFRREAEAAAQLEHPGIVPIFEIGTDGDQHYFTMGYVPGPSLSAKLLERPLEPREAATLIRDVALAVQYAHERGVVHRDLKPSNILLAPRSEGSHVRQNVGQSDNRPHSGECGYAPRITDFGLAKVTHADHSLTETGQIIGTPSYMPPEQASGMTQLVGPAADIYSLGAVLYACLTGRPPFQAASVLDTVKQVLERDPVSLRDLNAAIPQDLETICLKCLEKSIPRRYSSAKAVADELQRYLDGHPILARPVSRVERGWRWCRRNPVVAALTLGIVVSLVSGIVASTIFGIDARKAAKESQRQEGFAKDFAKDADIQKGIAQRAEIKTRETLEITQAARDEARRELARARQRLYIGDIRQAAIALSKGDVRETLRFLENQQPTEDGSDLRDWEWYYLRAQCFGHEAVYRGHESPVEFVEWNPAGDRFAAADSHGTVTVWGTQIEEPLFEWHTERQQPLQLRWDATGHWLAAFPAVVPKPENGQCFVWNTETGELALTEPANAVAWHSSRPTLAGAHPQQNFWTWNAGDSAVKRLSVQRSASNGTTAAIVPQISALTWLPKSDDLAIGIKGEVLIVHGETGESVKTLSGFKGELCCLSPSPNGQWLAGETRFDRIGSVPSNPPETILAWKLDSPQPITTWETRSIPGRLRWEPHDAFFVACPGPVGNSQVSVFNPAQTQPLLIVDGFDVSIHETKPLLAITDRKGATVYPSHVRPLSAGTTHTLRGHLAEVYAAAWHPQHPVLLTGGSDSAIRRWNTDDDRLRFLPRKDYIASTSSDERFQIVHHSHQGTAVLELFDHSKPTGLVEDNERFSTHVTWSRSGNRVAIEVSGELRAGQLIPGTLVAWDTVNAKQLWSVPTTSLRALDWSPNDRQLLRSTQKNQVELVSAADLAPQAEWTLEGIVSSLTWSPSGTEWACGLATVNSTGRVVPSKLEVRGIDGQLITRFGLPDGCEATHARPAFSPDGRLLAWGTNDTFSQRGRVFVWNLESREVVAELIGPVRQPTSSVVWNPSGTRLAVTDFRSTSIWDLASGMELIELEKGLGNNPRWSHSGKRLFGLHVGPLDASRGYDHAEPLPPAEMKTQPRRQFGTGFF